VETPADAVYLTGPFLDVVTTIPNKDIHAGTNSLTNKIGTSFVIIFVDISSVFPAYLLVKSIQYSLS